MDSLGSEQRGLGDLHFYENISWTPEVRTSTNNFQEYSKVECRNRFQGKAVNIRNIKVFAMFEPFIAGRDQEFPPVQPPRHPKE